MNFYPALVFRATKRGERAGTRKRGRYILSTTENALPSAASIPQLPHHKVKVKIKPGQRACNEKNEKGKICAGHLKRWFYAADAKEQTCGDVTQVFGENTEIYRCEHCKTLYLPHPDEPSGLNVAGSGQLSVFGLTIPAKETKG